MEKLTAIINKNEPHHVVLELLDEGGHVLNKKVKFNTFLKIIQKSSSQDAHGIAIGKMPNGYYNACVYEDGFKVIVSVPAGIFPFQYFEEIFTIPFPRLVFKFTCKEGRVVTTGCYAAKDEVLTDQSELFHYPFSNVYEDGHICWGRNEIPKIECLADIDKLVNIFYGAPSNNDLWRESYCGMKYPALRIALQELSEKDKFPVECLHPYMSYDGACNVADLLGDFNIG